MKISKYISAKAKEGTVIEKIKVPDTIKAKIPFVAKVTVRFGYTRVTFDLNVIVETTE